MSSVSNFRYQDAEAVKPASALDRQINRLIPSLLSKTMSELSPSADIMDIMKYGR